MNKTGSIITTITIIYRRNNNLTIMYVRDKNKDSQREFSYSSSPKSYKKDPI